MNELKIIEHKNQRVLLTSQLAESYGTDNKAISYNFNHNKERYKEGKHFYLLQGEELKAFREIHELPTNLNKVYLWTERGAFLHAKSLNTDKAWEVYDSLVEHYFKTQESKYELPTTPEEKIMLLMQASVNTTKKFEKVEERLTNLEENRLLNAGEYSFLNHKISNRIKTIKEVYKIGNTKEQTSELYKAINRDIKQITGIRTRSQLRYKHYEMVLDFVSEWEPSKATRVVMEQMTLL